MKTILVIGGGITGLSAMYELHKWKKENKSDVRLILAEASEDLGGKIRTVKKGEFVMESGADSIVSRKANTMSFIDELKLEDEVVYNATGRSFIYTDGEIKPIPADSVFGIPASVESLAKSTLVSAEGKVEALKDLYTKNEHFTKHDSVGAFLEHFLGGELVEKQIAPVLSGVYSGKLTDLTIASTLPYLLDYKEEYGSIIKGFEANKEKFQSNGEKKFFSFKNGLSTLINRFEECLDGVEINKNVIASKIEKVQNRYRVKFDNYEPIDADLVLLSIPQTAAQTLFKDDDLQSVFEPFKNSSLISVYAGYDLPDSLLPEEGTGFITAKNDDLSCNACTWTSRKWSHTSTKGNLLVRLFYKSSHPAFTSIQSMNEDELLQVARADIRKSLGITGEPVAIEITKWSGNMPNYQITHPNDVGELEKILAAAYPGIKVAGCSYYGVGIPDCIENGKKTAKELIKFL